MCESAFNFESGCLKWCRPRPRSAPQHSETLTAANSKPINLRRVHSCKKTRRREGLCERGSDDTRKQPRWRTETSLWTLTFHRDVSMKKQKQNEKSGYQKTLLWAKLTKEENKQKHEVLLNLLMNVPTQHEGNIYMNPWRSETYPNCLNQHYEPQWLIKLCLRSVDPSAVFHSAFIIQTKCKTSVHK